MTASLPAPGPAERPFATGCACAVSLAVAGAPWWAVGLCVLAGLAAFAIGVFESLVSRNLFPQDSADRLAWWKDRRGR